MARTAHHGHISAPEFVLREWPVRVLRIDEETGRKDGIDTGPDLPLHVFVLPLRKGHEDSFTMVQFPMAARTNRKSVELLDRKQCRMDGGTHNTAILSGFSIVRIVPKGTDGSQVKNTFQTVTTRAWVTMAERMVPVCW